MSSVICMKCKRTGDSKCPFCRSVFPDQDKPLDHLDTTLSYRLRITDDAITINLYKGEKHSDVFARVVNSVNRVVESGVTVEEASAVLMCAHEWEFLPGAGSEVGCGHHSPYPQRYLTDNGYRKGAIHSVFGWYGEQKWYKVELLVLGSDGQWLVRPVEEVQKTS